MQDYMIGYMVAHLIHLIGCRLYSQLVCTLDCFHVNDKHTWQTGLVSLCTVLTPQFIPLLIAHRIGSNVDHQIDCTLGGYDYYSWVNLIPEE